MIQIEIFILWLVFIFFGFILGMFVGLNQGYGDCEKIAIKYHCAEYNSITAKFQWKDTLRNQ